MYDWAYAECDRQHDLSVANVQFLISAYCHLLNGLDAESVCRISVLTNGQGYRNTPVTFADGGFALPASQVRHAMDDLWRYGDDLTPDEFAREFLIIHPFIDWNGRIASCIWNIMSGHGDNPVVMPFFFGDK